MTDRSVAIHKQYKILLIHQHLSGFEIFKKNFQNPRFHYESCLISNFDLRTLIYQDYDGFVFINHSKVESLLPFCEQVRNHPQLLFHPIIFVNNCNNQKDTIAAFHAGCSDVVTVPCNPDEFFIRFEKQFTNYQTILELHEINNTKDKFLSIISHDLRSPFTILLNFSKILYNKFDSFDRTLQKEYISAINDSAEHTYTILENLLRWSKANSGEIKFYPTRLNLTSVLYESILLLANDANQKNLNIYFNNQKEHLITADRNMLSVIFNNLINNAIKYSYPDGKIIISIEKNDSDYQIKISDNGTGIENERLDHLFKLGHLIKTPGTKNEQGAGLGLLIIKEFIDKHQGKIIVKSVKDSGSTFVVTLPSEA